MKTTGGMALVVTVGAGCGETDVIALAFGTVEVTINGLPTPVPSAGSALITSPTDAFEPLQVELAGAPTAVAQVPAGAYHVVYTPPAGYAIAAGTPNELDVTVVPNETVQVSFSVVAGTATLRITVSGLTAGATSGGSANVVRTDISGQIPFTVAIPDTGTVDRSIGVGTYSVTYTPPAGHQMAGGSPNQVSVAAGPSETATANFAVEGAATGTLHFAVTGLAVDATGGGSASILRTDIPGQSATSTTIGATGLADVTLAVGTYQVTYNPPPAYQLAAGQTNPRTLSITDGGQTDFQVSVQILPPPPDLVFHSDWSAALGTDTNAILDGGRWNLHVGNGRQCEVIPSTGLDFPTANVLRVAVNALGQAQIPRFTNIPVPVVGASLFYRWYIRVVAPNGLADPETHPMQDGFAIANCNWAWQIITNPADKWVCSWEFDATPAAPWPNTWFGRTIEFEKNQTYRFEAQLHRVSATHFNFHARVYDSANTLLYDDADWTNANRTSSLAANPAIALLDPANLNGLNAGINGLGNAPGVTVMYYQGGFAVRTNDWCGPYAGGV